MQIGPINYSLHFGSVKIHKNCLYWTVFSTDIYRKIFFNCLLCFFSYICWSVNCMSWVSKFDYVFLTCSETEARFIFEGLRLTVFSFMESSFPICPYFFNFFHLVYKLFKGLFQPLCRSVIFMSWVWIMQHISEMTRSVGIIYNWDLVVLLFMESSVYNVRTWIP